jgi:cytosine/adenosine deaminase-related metal-dependent hydrolase
MILHGARCAIGPHDTLRVSLEIADGRIQRLLTDYPLHTSPTSTQIDLSGFLVMPGLINAHDHLQFALYPKLGNPPYRNYIEWGEDIHATSPDVIAQHKSVPKEVRLWWGGIRNLLSGVTTVCHHDPLWPELQRESFPVKVVQQYGWAHSLALGGDLRSAHSSTPSGSPFILHACEGTDMLAREELFTLDRLGVLDENTVLVHSLAIDDAGVALLQRRSMSVILCPSSNRFLYGTPPPIHLLSATKNPALGSDSSLTAAGDLLDELRFAATHCGLAPAALYAMVTTAPAALLRLHETDGTIGLSGSADLIAIADDGDTPANRLSSLSFAAIELVLVRGQIRLASEAVYSLLPSSARVGLEPLSVDGIIRWLRAPVQELMRGSATVLGTGQVRLGGRFVRLPDSAHDLRTLNPDQALLGPLGRI